MKEGREGRGKKGVKGQTEEGKSNYTHVKTRKEVVERSFGSSIVNTTR